MKKKFKIICLIICVTLFPMNAFAAEGQGEEWKKHNGLQESQDKEISMLLEQRQKILFEKPVDIVQLNNIDSLLNSLGVEFLTIQEVLDNFSTEKNILQKMEIKNMAGENLVSPKVAEPESSVNTWVTYRIRNYYHNGQYYNIQKLVAQPTSESSPLWDEGQKNVNFSTNWKAGTTNLIKSVATSTLGALAPKTVSVYDALISMWNGLKSTSDIDPSEVIYRWETQTTAMFSYVRLESQSDSSQRLSLISTKCVTEVAYIVDVDAWRQNGNGAWVAWPEMYTGERMIYDTPTNYDNTANTISAYINYSGGPSHNAIQNIKISGPESKTVQTIYPCYPQFPVHCE